jgi:hypothetical protein
LGERPFQRGFQKDFTSVSGLPPMQDRSWAHISKEVPMSLFYPFALSQDLTSVLAQPLANIPPDPADDRRQRLIEAGVLDCCPDGDFLTLMPSVDLAESPAGESATWLRRVLGF